MLAKPPAGLRETLATLGILATVPASAGRRHHRPETVRRPPLRAAGRWLLALLLAGSWLSSAHAAPVAAGNGADVAPPGQPVSAQDIAFEADSLDYEENGDVVTATGNVHVSRNGDKLVADEVRWDRKTGKVTAKGNVVISGADGDKAYTDEVEVSENLRDGVVENLLLVTSDGSRLAATSGRREGTIYVLDHASYSPCRVEDDDGCPKEPTWQIQADRVIYDSARKHVKYTNAKVRLFGVALIPLPGLQNYIGDEGASGLLVPDIGYDRRNGFEVKVPYYWRLAPNRDLKVTPYLYSNVLPMIGVDYRALLSKGAYEITGYATVSGTTSITDPDLVTSSDRLRGYFSASGKFQFDANWSLTGSLRYVSDQTFLNRYDISTEDRLRSTVELDRRDEDSYLSIAGWDFQSLRAGDPAGQIPIALPAVDYRLRVPEHVLGGVIQFQANSLAILRTDGQDTQRAFVSTTWTRSLLTGLGQELSITALARGDLYHSAQNDLSPTIIYRGDPGWQPRGSAALAFDMRWPFSGPAFGGTQLLVPRIQLVIAPQIANLVVPNEDSRAVDLEDSNLFAINRFPGYDRIEDSSRITYGLDYRLDLPDFALDATIGQSYRLTSRASILPDGTGLSGRLSDIVGRVQLRYKDFLSIIHRFRVDKDNLAIRRNEVDATIGSKQTYAEIGYLRLNRNITAGVEDLRDVEEIRLAGRVAFARHWSVFGSTNIDLTGPQDDPTTTQSGFEPVRHRLGVAYEDDCVQLGFTWRRDYQTTGDAKAGNSFQLRLVFKNLGL